MVTPAHSEARRAMAKSIGLGRSAGQKVEQAAETVAKRAPKGDKAALGTG